MKQTVTDRESAAGLLRGQRPLLSAWYGNPLSRYSEANLLVAAQCELQARLRVAAPCFQCHVLQLVCNFQGHVDVRLKYEKLQAAARDTFERALLELVYGQLLMSCKQAGALRHLADGFALAAHDLASADYFQLLRRHELLAYLPLSDAPSLPQNLGSLLAEAAVIGQLQAGEVIPYQQTHMDTVG
ncbi:MAG TPA: hypothetical protein DCO71_04500 [Gammaproteobacteria bacterium]|nr:hypothetical protein [Gammaproteobacteria bacterium]